MVRYFQLFGERQLTFGVDIQRVGDDDDAADTAVAPVAPDLQSSKLTNH